MRSDEWGNVVDVWRDEYSPIFVRVGIEGPRGGYKVALCLTPAAARDLANDLLYMAKEAAA